MNKREAAAKRLEERQTSKRFKLPEGDSTFRVFPNKADAKQLDYIEYFMHGNVGPKKSYIRCGRNIKGVGECWLCDVMLPKLDASTKSAHRQVADAMRAKPRFAVQVSIIHDDGSFTPPALWEVPQSVANPLLGLMARRDIASPTEGYNLRITRVGTTLTTRYNNLERDDEASEVPAEVLAQTKRFGELLRKYDEVSMKAAYYGTETTGTPNGNGVPAIPVEDDDDSNVATEEEGTFGDDGDEETVTPPRPVIVAKANGKARPAPVPATEEEDDVEAMLAEEFDAVPELSEDPEPVTKRGKVTKVTKPVEQEEEADEETVLATAKRGKTAAVKGGKKVSVVDDSDF